VWLVRGGIEALQGERKVHGVEVVKIPASEEKSRQRRDGDQ
jgi:hypothetical protein